MNIYVKRLAVHDDIQIFDREFAMLYEYSYLKNTSEGCVFRYQVRQSTAGKHFAESREPMALSLFTDPDSTELPLNTPYSSCIRNQLSKSSALFALIKRHRPHPINVRVAACNFSHEHATAIHLYRTV